MLNHTYPRSAFDSVKSPYVAPEDLVERSTDANAAFATGEEYRLQDCYGDEIWRKLERAGFSPQVISSLSVLEVCAGTGFLTHHLLSRSNPKSLTVNDIAKAELDAARKLVSSRHPKIEVDWALGDMHTVDFEKTFDLILGNSFLHHFHNVPIVFARFADLLSEGGVFVSLHEPTLMATVVEGSKIPAYPLAVLAPKWVNELARDRYVGEPSDTDIWQFEPKHIMQVALESGFSKVKFVPWNLVRPFVAQANGLHLSKSKPSLSEAEQRQLTNAVKLDSVLNRFLPTRFFGSFCIICQK